MDTLLLKRAALLQAKLKVLDEQKDAFTDHAEILAFHRLKKQFDGLVASHKDQLPSDPLEAVREDFEKDKNLVCQLQRIADDAELLCKSFDAQHRNYLTPEFLEETIRLLAAKRESLQVSLSQIHARISHEYWSDEHKGLRPDAKVLAQFLSEDGLLLPEVKDWLAMSELKGPKYEKLLSTLGSIDVILRRSVFYILRAGEQLGPFLLDDIENHLAKRTIADSDLAWHHAVTDWLQLSELILVLQRQNLLPPPSKAVRFKRWAKHCRADITRALKRETGTLQ